MTAITWSEALALQQPRMDDTHREFVDLLNAMHAALDGEQPLLQQALDDFAAHTEAHFAQEDAWMARIGFAQQNCHGMQHQHVLEVVREVQRRLRADGDRAFVRELVPGLVQWFPMHAQTMDAALAQTMAERGFDPESGTVARPIEAEPITGCGSASCT